MAAAKKEEKTVTIYNLTTNDFYIPIYGEVEKTREVGQRTEDGKLVSVKEKYTMRQRLSELHIPWTNTKDLKAQRPRPTEVPLSIYEGIKDSESFKALIDPDGRPQLRVEE